MAETPTISVEQFTSAQKDGVFDKMMSSNKELLVGEFNAGRIKGPEYATVYLGSIQDTMRLALELLMGKDKLTAELALLEIERQKALIEKERVELEKDLVAAQINKLNVEITLANLEKDRITAETARINAQKALIDRQEQNAVKEGAVLDAQACKLKGEFDLIMKQIPKVEAETALLNQKQKTEQAQTNGVGVEENSVIGKQIALFSAQASGFARDAEQKVAKLLIDTWNVRRTTDEGTLANGTNRLDDATIGRSVQKLLEGIGA